MDHGALPLFPTALLAVYRKFGDLSQGQETDPIQIYDWTTTYPDGTVVVDPYSMWHYLCDDPTLGWPIYDTEIIKVIAEANMSTLYLGGGSGRHGNYLATQGITCHNIDTSEDAITLMGLRGASCELMNCMHMTYADGAYPLVVLGFEMFDTLPDPAGAIAEAARVAEKRVIVSGCSMGDAIVPLTGKLEWNDQEETTNYWCYPVAQIVEWMEAAGLTIIRAVEFSNDGMPEEGEAIDELYWVVEAEWSE